MKRPLLAPLRQLIFERAGDRCELIFEDSLRCTARATDLHHRVPRRAGGNHLDLLATVAVKHDRVEQRHLAHLMALCSEHHHEVAHGEPKRAAALGVRVLGQMRHERWSGQSWYSGPDEEFAALWPKEEAA